MSNQGGYQGPWPTGQPNPNNPANPNATNPSHFPGLTPPGKQAPTWKPEYDKVLKEMSAHCERLFHKPMVIKVIDDPDNDLYYVCEKELKKFFKMYPDAKELVIAIER